MPQPLALFHFLRPDWLWALLPFVLVLLLWYRREGKSRSWQSYCDAELLPFLMVGSEAGRSHLMMVVGGLAGLLTIIALAGPTWEMRPQPLFRSQSAMVIALDLSLSMNATDVRPNRLERAKLKLRDILERRKEGQTGLMVFAGESFVVTPLTTDTATITSLLNSIGTKLIPAEAQGSHPERALLKAVELMRQAGMVQGDILLISDGTDAGCGERCIDAAAAVKRAGYRLSVISVGTRDGAPIPTAKGYLKDRDGTIVIPKLDNLMLSEMAQTGGGRFSPLRGDDADIDGVLALASSITNQQIQSSDEESQQWYESGPWLLIILLPLAALFYRRGVLIIPIMIMFTPKGEALAEVQGAEEALGSGLWLNDNQRAERLLESGRALEAVDLFNNKKWQAAAQYRAGHFDETVKLLEGEQEITSQYNYANAQAQLGKFPEAIKAYESVLKWEPNHEDARYNLELIKKMQQQQEQQQQGEGGAESEDGNRQDNGEGGEGDDSQGEQKDGNEQGESGQDGQDDPQEAQQNQSDAKEGKAEEGDDGESPKPEQRGPDDEDSNAKESESEQPQDGESTAEGEQSAERYDPKGDANDQWLRQIPDDPGELLQRKFKYQYRQSFQDRKRDNQPW